MKLRMCGAVLLCIMVLVGVIACSSGVSKAPDGMTTSEMLASCQNATASINTIQEYGVANMSGMGEEMNMSMPIFADKPNRTLYEAMTFSMLKVELEWYILNDWAYVYNPVAKAKWAKTPLTEAIWNEYYTVDQQLAKWNNLADVQYVGTELVGEINRYKITGKPDVDALSAALNAAFNTSGYDNISSAIKSSSETAWIDENTYYPVKMSMDETVEMGNSTILVNLVATFSNINQPVSIVLPAEAQNATAVNYSQFISGKW